MYKKIFIFITAIVISCFLGFYYLSYLFTSSLDQNTPCAFCKEEVLESQKFYETDLVMALYTHKPIVKTHFLIVPKRHVERLENLYTEEVLEIYQVMKKVHQAAIEVFKTPSYVIYQKNGREVGQTVPHVHFHMICKKIGDDSALKFLMRMILAQVKKPLSSEKIQLIRSKMESAMNLVEDEQENTGS